MVWFGKLDLPDDVVEAHRDGNLVIFVGAGASVAPPSSLPGFKDLTAQIANEAGVSDPNLDDLDITLGEIEADYRVDVHGRIATLIDREGSRPNAMHSAIAQLAKSGKSCRIVTTNYDRHLTAALEDAGVSFDEWAAPALPVGDDFEGLVYLHGTLGQPPRRLVATDEDFGRAYLREAWATRFLEPMFSEFVVVFVGYSHNDMIMRYLGRGLRSRSRRWILTDQAANPLYRRLHIQPIAFEVRDGSYTDAERGLARWGAVAGMGMLDHQTQLRELLGRNPPELPEEISYLEATLSDPARTRMFTELAKGLDWLNWAATQRSMRRLFDEHEVVDECGYTLAWWFARDYVVDAVYSTAALALVIDNRGRIHEQLWSGIARNLLSVAQPRGPWFAQWVLLLVRDTPATSVGGILGHLLDTCELPAESGVVLALLDHLLEPRCEIRRGWWDDQPKLEIRFPSDEYALEKAVQTVVQPHLSDLAVDLLAIVDHHLRAAHAMLAATNPGATSDPLTAHRSAIEPHPQDEFREALDVLIDLARDCLQVVGTRRTTAAAEVIEAWRASSFPLLRRLAVHGMNSLPGTSASEKLTWLHDRNLTWDFDCHHEVFRLIADNLAHASDDTVYQLVDDLVAGPPEDDPLDEDTRTYAIFNALAWVLRSSPDLRSAKDAIAGIRREHPQWKVREHPDLHTWMSEVEWTSHDLPISVAELHAAIDDDPSAALERLESFRANDEADTSSWAGTPEDAVVATVAEHLGDGLQLLDADPSDTHRFHAAVVRGWQRRTPELEIAGSIATALSTVDVHALAADIATMFVAVPSGSTPVWPLVAAARNLARAVWDVVRSHDDSSALSQGSILDRAHNSVPGKIADFWVTVLIASWREAGTNWSGLPDELKDEFDALIGPGGSHGKYLLAQAVVVSRLDVMWSADREWAHDHLFPLMKWTTNERPADLWLAYLVHGRWNDQMLDAGLLHEYVSAAEHLGSTDDSDTIGKALANHLASIALFSTLDLPGRNWLSDITTALSPQRRVAWFEAIAWQLRRIPAHDADGQWTRWMRRYLADRLDTVPRPLEPEEASAAADWVVRLDDDFGDGVDLILSTGASFNDERMLLRDLLEARATDHPTDSARLVAHLLDRTEPSKFWDHAGLADFVAVVKREASRDIVDTIRASALRLGVSGAEAW